MRSRQVLVDKAPGASTSGLEDLSESELVEKAKLAYEQLEQASGDAETQISFVGARKLHNGGVIYEMGSTEAAQWLKGKTNMTNFLQVFSATSIIKHRAYSIIAEYIPLTFDPTERGQIAEIKRVNGLNPDDILSAKWIKPATSRHQGQCSAHAILGFTQPTGANAAIRNGGIIAGKRVWARKLLQEPQRCLKCQKVGASHIAAECKQEKDTCGSCGNDHRTTECTITDTTLYKCVNCNESGHAAWDCQCSTFIRANSLFNAKHPENRYRYFPTALDPTSWELLSEQENLGVEPGGTTQSQQQQHNTVSEQTHGTGWIVVNRRQREVRTQAMNGANSRGRANPANRGNITRAPNRPTTGANATPGPNGSTGGTL